MTFLTLFVLTKSILVDDDDYLIKKVDYPGNKKEAKVDGSQKTVNVSEELLVSVVKEKVHAAVSKSSYSFSPPTSSTKKG